MVFVLVDDGDEGVGPGEEGHQPQHYHIFAFWQKSLNSEVRLRQRGNYHPASI
jgi:hypothetical protein